MELLALLAVGLGILTAGVAKRYRRDPLGWGVFGGLLFIIAMPLLFYLGRREPTEARRRSPPPQVVRRSASGDHLPGQGSTPRRLVDTSPVVGVLASEGSADFATLAERTALDEPALMDELENLLDHNLVEVEAGLYVLTRFARRLT